MTAPEDSRATEEWGEKMLVAIAGGYQAGQRISEEMSFVSKKSVSEVTVLYRHRTVVVAWISASGVPTLEKRTEAYNHYTVKLRGLITDGAIPGRYEPFQVRYRIDGKWTAYNSKRKALNSFEVIEASPT